MENDGRDKEEEENMDVQVEEERRTQIPENKF